MTDANPYPEETLDPDDDDGTMPENVDKLRAAVIGHRIVSAEQGAPTSGGWYGRRDRALILTLDDGTKVELIDTDDCCAYTALDSFLFDPSAVDHVITGVGTTDGYTQWHIYADMGDVLLLDVDWSSGNPFYYGYGFYIKVRPAE
jgi:hypothetical protein